MVDDFLLFLRALKLLERQPSRAKDRLWRLIEACHALLLTFNRQAILPRDLMIALTDRRRELLFLTMIMVDPTDEVQEYTEACLTEDEAFRGQVRITTEKMLHALSRSADNELLRTRLTHVNLLSAQFDTDTDTRSHTQSPDNSHQQAATRAATSRQPPRRSDPFIERSMLPRSSSTAAADTQLAGLSLQQADPSPSIDQIGGHSTRQGDPSPPSYQKGDLIDLVASRKATPEQLRSFKSQALSKETFYQQALDRLDIYSSSSEEQKGKRLRALLESVINERTKTTAGGSDEQPRKREEATKKKQTEPNQKRTRYNSDTRVLIYLKSAKPATKPST